MNKLLEITPQYRSFVDDQVLTAGQLNEFIEYFEDQDRLTRVCLTGVGLACGFVVSLQVLNSIITITQGCGLTTDGDLLKLQENIAESSEKSIDLDKIAYSHFKQFEDDKASYGHFKNGNATIPLFELIPESIAGDDDAALPLNQLDLLDKVVLLYLECYPKDPDICTTTNCDNQGQTNIQNIKVLLASKTNVETVINSKDEIFTKYDIYEAITNLPQTAIKKVVLNAGIGSQNNISTFVKLAAAYKGVITIAKTDLHSAYGKLFAGFSEILSINNGTKNTVLNQLNTLANFNSNNGIQYRYDLVKDLSDTFNEISTLLLKLKTECCPDIESFPKHLLLGCLFPTEDYPQLRHEFYHSPVNNDYERYLKMAKSLVNRVVICLDNFNISIKNSIDITPSFQCGPLGEKAIPVYYEPDAGLLNFWDFNKTENYKQLYNLSFHKANLAPNSWVKTPLQFDLDCRDFYRIEGHIGRPGLVGRDAIDKLRDENGLDFDCIIFNLQTNAKEFSDFVKEHHGVSHLGGVPKGGTFVLISENDVSVADFCLSYKLVATSKNQECCSLMECTYPWISSLKYINNLSRSTKGTQSRNRPMPQNYSLQVIEYKINGQSLINTTTTINIPMSQIFLRRIHAITDAFNKRFDKGVVFDFNESQKRLVITRAKEDTYTIRMREVSMANNNPIYTYSNTGMFRNNKIFRLDAMRCRDLRGYSPSFYEKLQKQIAPVNKDDDYGAFDEKWRKWSTLTERLITNPVITQAGLTRMVTSFSQLPSEIRTLVNQIKTTFNQVGGTGTNLQFRLDGDWVNGTWVNKFMLDHHRRNSKNTHDNIVLFVNLRKFLHNETGVTKLSIYLANVDYSPEFNQAITTYKSVADIYFGAPKGENAITI